MVHDVYYGRTLRKSYARHTEPIDMPNLIEIQKNSYQWFLDEGLREVFRDMGSITDYTGNLELSFIDYTLDENPKYSVMECKARDATFAAPLKVRMRLRNRETEEIKEQEIFMGDFPLMTASGTFVINGAERVIVSQVVRSPGMYFEARADKAEKEIYAATIIPYRGAWIEYETDLSDIYSVRIDKNRKLPVTSFIRALGVTTNAEILEMFGEDERLVATLDRDIAHHEDEALIEIYKRLRPGEPPTVDSARTLINNLFFDPKRYDLSNVGRYKFNKKLAISTRINGRTLAEPVVDPLTGELLAEAGETLTRERAQELERHGVNRVSVQIGDRVIKIFSNNVVNLSDFVDFDPRECGIRDRVRFDVLQSLMAEFEGEELRQAVADHADELVPKHITV